MKIDIKNALNKHNIEIKNLAEKMGISRQSLHYFINRGNENTFETIVRLSEVSGIRIEEFFVETANYVCPHCGNKINIEVKA